MGKVIITADDYGACQYIDDGIERAINGGHINTVSTFVTHNRSKESVKKLYNKRKATFNGTKYAFNIGLHFSITSGFSLQGRDTSLTVASDNSPYYFVEAKRYPFNSINEIDLQNEIIAQLDQLDEWLEDELIDHVTVHHGVLYLQHNLYETFIKTISEYKGRVGKEKYTKKPISIRSPQSWFRAKEVPNCCYSPETGDKLLVSEIVVEGFELGYWTRLTETTNSKMQIKIEEAKKCNISTTDYLVDVIYNLSCVEGISCLLETISKNDITAELMFHLGFQEGAENMNKWDFENQVITEHGINKYYFLRRMTEELKTIEDINLGQKIKDMNIETIFYSDLS